MNKSKKIKRAVIHSLIIYIMINGLVYGLMKAYMNSYNAVNRQQLKMASVVKNGQAAKITLLDKEFTLDFSDLSQGAGAVCVYTIIPDKAKAATEIVMRFERYFRCRQSETL